MRSAANSTGACPVYPVQFFAEEELSLPVKPVRFLFNWGLFFWGVFLISSGKQEKNCLKNMGRIVRICMLFLLIVLFVANLGFVGPVSAELEWTFRKPVPLTSAPLDNAISSDGELLFMLSAGEVVVYSLTRNKRINTIPIDRDYDRISVSPGGNSLILTSSAGKSLKIIDLEFIYQIDTSGLPLKGPADAPVTIAVFSDYQ
jgi:hypothetical protein